MSDSTEVRALLLQINANTELLKSNLSEAEKAVAKFHTSTVSHLEQLDGRWALVGKSIESLERPLERLKSLGELAIASLLGESLLSKGREALEFAGNIEFMAKQVGTSTDFLQKYNYAAGQYGVATEVADTALTKFTRTIGEAANGNKLAIALFDRLGVKVRDQNGNVRSAEVVYKDFSDAIAKVDNHAQQTADVLQAMGRNAGALVPLVAKGSEGFNELAKAAEELGIVLSPELIEHAEEVNHKLAAMRQIVDAEMASAVASNAANLEHLASQIITVAGAVAKFLGSHPKEAVALLSALAGGRFGGIYGAFAGGVAGLVFGPEDPAPTREDLKAQIAAKRKELADLQKPLPEDTFAQRIANNFGAADRNTNIQSLKDDIAYLRKQLAKTPATPGAEGGSGNGSDGAGVTNASGEDLKKAQADLADLEHLKVGASGVALKAINSEIAEQQRYIGFLKQGVSAQQAKTLASREGSELTRGESEARRAARKAEEQRKKALEDDTAYHQQELQLEKSILQGAKSSAGTYAARDALQKQIINEEADELAAKIRDRAAQGGYSTDPKENAARAKHLLDLNEQNRLQGLANVDLGQIVRDQKTAVDKAALDLEGQIDLLGLQDQLAITRKERLRIELELLKRQRDAGIAAQQAIVDSKDPNVTPEAKDAAKTRIGQINQQYPVRVAALQQQNSGPIDAYRRQLHQDTDDMNEALQGVAVHGLDALTSGLTEVISGTKSLKSAFKDMAASIIADLARIAIEKAIVHTIGGSFFGLKDGGEVPGFASGGLTGVLRGPGGPRTDSMLIRASTGEFITNAASTRRYLPLLKAINDNNLPGFANGGAIGAVRVPTISSSMLQSGAPSMLYVDLSNSFVDSALWDKVDAIARQHAAGAEIRATAAGARLAQVKVGELAGRRMGL